jgi:hypothetical protein
MSTIATSSPARLVNSRNHTHGLLAELRDFWREFSIKAFDPYRPELHYMRGPGPAWRAKHAGSSHLRST